MKPLSERMAQKILDHGSIISLRPDISPEIQELIRLEDKLSSHQERLSLWKELVTAILDSMKED